MSKEAPQVPYDVEGLKADEGDNGWRWCRFKANLDDPRPMTWPPPGPYWVSGTGDGYSTIVAYLPDDARDLRTLWPEADEVDMRAAPDGPRFTGRFPKPDWWTEDKP